MVYTPNFVITCGTREEDLDMECNQNDSHAHYVLGQQLLGVLKSAGLVSSLGTKVPR